LELTADFGLSMHFWSLVPVSWGKWPFSPADVHASSQRLCILHTLSRMFKTFCTYKFLQAARFLLSNNQTLQPLLWLVYLERYISKFSLFARHSSSI